MNRTVEQLKQVILGMMAGDQADIEVIREIQAQKSRAWKKYCQAFSGLDAQDIASITEGAR